tara:strand:- start:11802 stop:13079 length:1278 start_codon:yes stop_codon:yes gene_type:complete
MKLGDTVPLKALYTLEPKVWWQYFKSESFSFKMICLYLFVEYVRPQLILPWLDILPWAKLFVLGALVGLLVEKNEKWVYSPINKWMVLFFISILWSSLTAYKPEVSYEKIVLYFNWFITYFLITNIVRSPQRFLFFLAIICLASFKISLSLTNTWAKRGFAFTDWGLKGPPGFFENSGELAIQMAVFWPIGLAVALALRPYVPAWKYWILMLMPTTACIVILGASSRGGQLAMAIQFVIRFFKKIFNFKALFAIIFVVTMGWYFLPEEQKQRFNEAGDDKTSQQRLNYWEAGYEMMNDYPLTGVGYFNFPEYFSDNYSHMLLVTFVELPHNIFIQVGADLGYPGLIIYLMAIYSSISMLYKSRKQNISKVIAVFPCALFLSFLGFLIAGQFVSVVYYPFMWIHFALCSSLYHIANQKVTNQRKAN